MTSTSLEPQGSVRRDAVITALTFCVSAAILFMALINDDWVDSYIHLRAAERVSRGEAPYRDFFTFWFPGAPLFLSGWFSIFGFSMASVHALQALCGACIATLGLMIARITIAKPFVYVVPLLLIALYVAGNEGVNHTNFSVALALLAIWAALKASDAFARGYCVLAGASAGLAGMFTISAGAWLGLALIASTMFFKEKRRQSALFVAVGGSSVLLILLLYLLGIGALMPFYEDAIVWPRNRYLPFHTGVGWGAWLPPWKLLGEFSYAWKPTWTITLALVWGQTYVFPLLPVVSLLLLVRRFSRERGILLLAATALILAAFPNAAPMRMLRLSAPLWLLIIYELGQVLSSWPRFRALASGGLALLFAAVVPLQWSYRHQLSAVETPRGTTLLQPASVMEYRVLEQVLPPESRVTILPEYRPAAWLLKYDNPTRYDTLTPILYTRQQLQEACDEVAAAGYPPLVKFNLSALATIDGIESTFGPSQYKGDWSSNPLFDMLGEHYDIVLQYPPDAPVIIGYRERTPSR